MASTSRHHASVDDQAGIVPSHGISIDIPGPIEAIRPSNIRHISTPAYESPLRHHRPRHSSAREVKETLHARSEYTNSEDDGGAIHRINQYQIKQEIGRGSFGAVHLAVDQHGQEYAVKEFSKSRLRKRAQSNILRRPPSARKAGHLAASRGFSSPLYRHSASDIDTHEDGGNPLYLIREEIAIMKKLNHPNLVSLIEVLDDPAEDSLYMVLEMCKKGVVMKVGIEEKADPYDDESCRCWFRDLILGIEYLHAQGVVHRDIKPDNLLLTDDDMLKIVDFGVSEMFTKSSEMLTAKSAGSPAFLPPELCVAKHGDISGKAADIWSMGVTLYCLRFGEIPFKRIGVLDLYEAIKNEPIKIPSESDEDFKDLICRILEKDPSKRIQMRELREHPWVTKCGADPLLSAEENTANLVEPPTEEETNEAITGNLSNILFLMKAVKKFKKLIANKRPQPMEGILGKDVRIVQPPLSLSPQQTTPPQHKTRSVDTFDRRPIERALVAEGVHRVIDFQGFSTSPDNRLDAAIAKAPASPQTPTKPMSPSAKRETSPQRGLDARPGDHRSPTHPQPRAINHGKGHAHDPLLDHLFLAIGPGGNHNNDSIPDPPAVSESPPATDINIYEAAYHKEIQRLREQKGKQATLYLTRRVDQNKAYQQDDNLVGRNNNSKSGVGNHPAGSRGGFAKMLEKIRAKKEEKGEEGKEEGKEPEVEKEEHGTQGGS